MDSEIDEDAVLDHVIFHTSPKDNSYKALACSDGKIETAASGPLDQLVLYLPQAKGCQDKKSGSSFKLQIAASQKQFPWFTKGSLARFLQVANTPDALKAAKAIEDEISQLEETRKFHISLYSKDQEQSAGRKTGTGGFKEVGLNQQIKVETATSDATKNELLRALDLRLTALEEELVSAFNRAVGASCTSQQISDLSAFTDYFGATELRNFLSTLLVRKSKDQPTDLLLSQPVSLEDMRNGSGILTQASSHLGPDPLVKPLKNVVSPAKIAQAERQSSSESDQSSSEASDVDDSYTERSRPVMRSATPRRSASPMRRIQIGRSGSRRSTSLTIKSLSYFPPRDRTATTRDGDEENSGNEGSDQPPTKPANPVRRMSVQDAISLFERKQKDQNSDIQKRNASGEVLASTTAKSVLRRWSAGMGDSFTQNSCENVSYATAQETREDNRSAEVMTESSNTDEAPLVAQSSEADNSMLPPMSSPVESVESKVEEVNGRSAISAEWSQQKEAELNQLLMKMMETKAAKPRVTKSGQQDEPSEKRGDFYSQYKEIKDEKLRAEHAGKRAVKAAQFKVMKDTLEQSKTRMGSKPVTSTGKHDPPNNSQRPRRNSSPPVLPKKEVSKPAATRKASPKSPQLPATRNSWSAGSLPKTNATTPKTPGAVSTNSTTTRRKPLSAPHVSQPSPKAERLQQSKVKKVTPEVKPNMKAQEQKLQKPVTKSSKTAKTKSSGAPGEDSGVLSAKPSFYNKVTKKNSVVPLESKPFLRKGTGVAPKGSPMATKPKVCKLGDSSKATGNVVQLEKSESSVIISETTLKEPEVADVQPENVSVDQEDPVDNVVSPDHSEEFHQGRDELGSNFSNAVELPVPEIQVDEDMGISSAAWVEVEREESSASCENGLPALTVSPEISSAAALSSPRVRHSLSQMLQADSNEPEVIEWGNAENPPALVYQKDAPKGFKRLLKFARKSKGEANTTGWGSPSVFSEGEDDSEETKAATKRNSDALLRKAARQAKGYEPPKSVVTGSIDGGNSFKRSMDSRGMNELPAQSGAGTATILDRLREGQNSASTTSAKGATNQVRQSFDKGQQFSAKSWWK